MSFEHSTPPKRPSGQDTVRAWIEPAVEALIRVCGFSTIVFVALIFLLVFSSGAYFILHRLDLGEFLMRASPRPIATVSAAIDAGVDGAEVDDLAAYLAKAGPDGTPFDPACSLELTPDRGGNAVRGLGWSGERVFGVLVEIADPTPQNLIFTRIGKPGIICGFLGLILCTDLVSIGMVSETSF